MKKAGAAVGVADHCGWAVLMTVARDGTFLDRRRVELLDPALPKLAHHHEAQAIPLPDALVLIDRVTRSAAAHARAALEALASSVPAIRAIGLRACPPLPATIPERLSNYRAQNVADSVMYRQALAEAARSLGWSVHWYETRRVAAAAAEALAVPSITPLLTKTGSTLGPPWTQDHRTAMSAAIAALR